MSQNQIGPVIADAELREAFTALYALNHRAHDAFMALPDGASNEAPVLYYALSGACGAVGAAIDALRTLEAAQDARAALARL